MLDRSEVGKRGYLHEDFRLFHLKDSRAQKLDYHYHEFDKLILVLGGRVSYVVEGVTYFLQPWDLLLIQHNLIHRPIIDPAEPYERVVVWLGREWLERRSDPGEALSTCFDTTRQRGFHLLRFDALPICRRSSGWRRLCGNGSSVLPAWRTRFASSC